MALGLQVGDLVLCITPPVWGVPPFVGHILRVELNAYKVGYSSTVPHWLHEAWVTPLPPEASPDQIKALMSIVQS